MARSFGAESLGADGFAVRGAVSAAPAVGCALVELGSNQLGWTASPVAIAGDLAALLPKAGGTMTGPLIVAPSGTGQPIETHSNYALGIDLYTHADAGFRAPYINYYKSRGSQGLPTAVTLTGYEQDSIGGINFGGYDGSQYFPGAASIFTQVSKNWSPTSHGAFISIYGTRTAANALPQQIIQFGGCDPTDLNAGGSTDDFNIISYRPISFGGNKAANPIINYTLGSLGVPAKFNLKVADDSDYADVAAGAAVFSRNVSCKPALSSGVGLTITGLTSQSGNLFEVKNVSNSVLASINSIGWISSPRGYFSGELWIVQGGTNNIKIGSGIHLGSTSLIGFTSGDPGATSDDITVLRNSAGQLDVRGDNGLRVRNGVNGNWANIQAGSITVNGNIDVWGILNPLRIISNGWQTQSNQGATAAFGVGNNGDGNYCISTSNSRGSSVLVGCTGNLPSIQINARYDQATTAGIQVTPAGNATLGKHWSGWSTTAETSSIDTAGNATFSGNVKSDTFKGVSTGLTSITMNAPDGHGITLNGYRGIDYIGGQTGHRWYNNVATLLATLDTSGSFGLTYTGGSYALDIITPDAINRSIRMRPANLTQSLVLDWNELRAQNSWQLGSQTSSIDLFSNATLRWRVDQNGNLVSFDNTGSLLAPNTIASSANAIVHRGAYLNYNAGSSGTVNVERFFGRWNANVYQIGTESAGTGVLRDMQIVRNGSALMQFGTTTQVFGTFSVSDTINQGSADARWTVTATGKRDSQVGNGSGTWQTGYREEYNVAGARCGFFGATPVAQQSIAAAATDAATTQTLANSLRTAFLNLGLGV